MLTVFIRKTPLHLYAYPNLFVTKYIRSLIILRNFLKITSEAVSCLCSLILTMNTNSSDSINDYVTIYQALQMVKNCGKLTKYCKLLV